MFAAVEAGQHAAVGQAAQSDQARTRHQAIAVQADQLVGPRFLQLAQRFLDQQLAADVLHHHVLFLGEQAQHVGQRHAHLLAALAAAQEGARFARGLVKASPRALQGIAQALQPHRLEQVIRRAQFERLQRVRLVGGTEDHLWPRAPGQAPRQRNTIDAGHVDVQQQYVRLQLVERGQRGFAVGERAHQLRVAALAQQRGHARAGQRFVVDDQHAHHGDAPGRRSSTM